MENNLGSTHGGFLNESAGVEGIFYGCFAQCEASYISDFYLTGENAGLKVCQEPFL